MLGFTIKPTWWETQYGPAPYTSNNLVMWEDIQEGKIKALRDTWDGFKKASDADLIQMIAEVEGGDVNLGGGGTTTPEYTPRITTTELPPAPAGVTSEPVVSDTAPAQSAAPTETVAGTAELPEEGTSQGGQEEAPAARPASPAVPPLLLRAVG